MIDNLEIANINTILNATLSGEATALLAEFKVSLNSYLKELVSSPVRSLADVIAFNQKFSDVVRIRRYLKVDTRTECNAHTLVQEMIKEFGQDIFLASQVTNGIGDAERRAVWNLANLTKNGFEKVMVEKKLDAVVSVGAGIAPVLAIGGFPGIIVPAAYDGEGVPVGICFSGLKGFEPRLIQISYGFEQATKSRKPPTFLP